MGLETVNDNVGILDDNRCYNSGQLAQLKPIHTIKMQSLNTHIHSRVPYKSYDVYHLTWGCRLNETCKVSDIVL